jgi:rubredoxin
MRRPNENCVAENYKKRWCCRYNEAILSNEFKDLMTVTENNKTWMCLICGWIYDEATGCPEHGIAAGTAWLQVPMNWTCPECGARKEDFEMVQI